MIPPTGRGVLGRCRIDKLAQFAPRRKGDMIDLCEVVIFARQPEDGDVRTSRRRRLAGARQRRRCFEGRKQRSAEESNLLPGDNDTGAVVAAPRAPPLPRRTGF